MTECQIPSCGRPVDDAALCNTCTANLRTDLADLAWLLDELWTVIAKQTAYGPTGGGRRAGGDPPLPSDRHAGTLIGSLRNILADTIRATDPHSGRRIAAETLRDGPACDGLAPGVQTARMAMWLSRHVEPIRHLPDAADHHDAITAIVADIRHTIDAPANRAAFTIGTCPDCGGILRAVVPKTGDAHIGCGRCRATWPPDRWLHLGTVLTA